MGDFIANTYGDKAEYETVRLSGDFLSKKVQKLINNGMMYVMEDVIGLTGTNFLFTIPFCAN